MFGNVIAIRNRKTSALAVRTKPIIRYALGGPQVPYRILLH
jgi:hypothetical protein